MNRQRVIRYGLIALGILIVLGQTLYIVDQRQQAIVLRLGEPVRVVNALGDEAKPGLKIKIPFIENVIKFDKRNQSFETREEEIIAGNQERLVVDAFVRFRITNPLRFYTALRDERTAADRLERLVISSMRQTLGTASSEDIVSRRRSELTRQIVADMQRRVTASRMGVEIIDVRIRRADLPAANEAAVFERMKTARLQEAAEIRAIGQQQRQQIVADATRQAETIRGEGDAERAKTFADSFGRDPSFASFYRSMSAYEASMGKGDTTMVLSPDSEFFKYFERGPTAR
ncbi:MAG TPA: protease modulator HflC [Caulobacteraceae bacterium]|nr:protease modulator HflC [Caulobacteraceae bacterium]